MIMSKTKTPPRFGEFVVLMAVIISLVAFCIDAMLPALSTIADELGVRRANNSQLIISLFILGLAAGQVVYGPLSDSTGRKPALYAGLGLFIVGSVVSMLSTGFAMMLAGRIIQGLGLAGPRSVTVAIIRDRYEGRAMARVMSFVMAVFIIVPAIAPALGQGILFVAGWRAIFAGFSVLGLVVFTWFGLRQPETLAPVQRVPFSVGRIAGTIREICAIRETLNYTLAAGLVFGSFPGLPQLGPADHPGPVCQGGLEPALLCRPGPFRGSGPADKRGTGRAVRHETPDPGLVADVQRAVDTVSGGRPAAGRPPGAVGIDGLPVGLLFLPRPDVRQPERPGHAAAGSHRRRGRGGGGLFVDPDGRAHRHCHRPGLQRHHRSPCRWFHPARHGGLCDPSKDPQPCLTDASAPKLYRENEKLMKTVNPAYIEELKQIVNTSPYPRHMSMALHHIEPDKADITLALGPPHMQPFGIVHGGVLATLIDTATFWAAFLRLPEDAGLVNVDLKLNYLQAVTGGRLIAKGICLRAGRTVSYAEAKVFDETQTLLAHGTSTLMALEGKGLKLKAGKFLED